MSIRPFGTPLCTGKRRTFAYVLFVLILLSGGSYWFVMHTSRGSSLALYTIGGWNAPVSVKIACGKETDAAVIRKFELPLAFDEATKNKLRGFWYYSFYLSCLFAQGYDFKGNSVPQSSVSTLNENSQYANTYGGFSFALPGTITLVQDNVLDVEYDDQLLQTELVTSYGTISLQTFLKHNTFKTSEDIASRYSEEPFSDAKVSSFITLTATSGIKVVHIREEQGLERLIFLSTKGYVVHLSAPQFSDALIKSLLITLR